MNFENFNDFCKSELVLREEFRDLTVKSDARERIHRDRFGTKHGPGHIVGVITVVFTEFLLTLDIKSHGIRATTSPVTSA